MKNTFAILGLLFALLTCQFVYAQKGEEKKVIKSFEKYTTAISRAKGETAVKFVDSKTLNYYETLLIILQTEDTIAFETLKYVDKTIVRMIAQNASKEEVLSFDKKGMFVFAVNNEIISKRSVPNRSIETVTITENNTFAKAEFAFSGETKPLYVDFYKEEKKVENRPDLYC
jgi:hypothetical protein